MERFITWILGHRALLSVLIGVVTFGALYKLSQAEIGTSMGKLFFGESPSYQVYLERCKSFATDEVLLIGLEDFDPLAPESLDRIEAVITAFWDETGSIQATDDEQEGEALFAEFDSFEDLDETADPISDGVAKTSSNDFGVRRIDSVLSATQVTGRDGGLEVQFYATDARDSPERKPELLEALRADELVGGLLVSADGKHTTLVVEVPPDPDRQAELHPLLNAKLQELLVRHGVAVDKIRTAGLPAMMAEMTHLASRNLVGLTPIAAALLAACVWLLFRALLPAMIALLVCGVGVTWTMGFSLMLDNNISIMHSIVPVVILIVGSSDVVHLWSAYLLELDTGKDQREAIVAAGSDVGRACLYTSITTFIGFIGLSFVPTPVMRQLGVVLGTGVGFTLLLALLVLPIIQSVSPRPKTWRVGATSAIQATLDRALDVVARWTTLRPWPFIIAFALVLGTAIYGMTQLTIESSMSERFPEDNQISKDRRWFQENFSSSDYLQLFIEAPEANGLLEPDVMHAIAELQDQIEDDPEVDAVHSVVDLYSLIHEQLRPEGDKARLPQSREAFAQYTLLFEMGGGTWLESMLDFERKAALMSVRLNSEKMRKAYDDGKRFIALGDAILPAGVSMESSGALALVGGWLGALLEGQKQGVLFTLVLIACMMVFMLKSVRTGLLSMIPNVLPLFVLGGWLGLTEPFTDSDALILAMLAIGIGVDDTIHFMVRLKTETLRCGDREEAIKKTFSFAGRAIVMTTAVLTIGFLPLAFTGYYSTAIMGTLLPMTLIVALLADLLLVPALASVGWLTFERSPRSATEA